MYSNKFKPHSVEEKNLFCLLYFVKNNKGNGRYIIAFFYV